MKKWMRKQLNDYTIYAIHTYAFCPDSPLQLWPSNARIKSRRSKWWSHRSFKGRCRGKKPIIQDEGFEPFIEPGIFWLVKFVLNTCCPVVSNLWQENITEVPQITIEHVPVEKVVKKPVEACLQPTVLEVQRFFAVNRKHLDEGLYSHWVFLISASFRMFLRSNTWTKSWMFLSRSNGTSLSCRKCLSLWRFQPWNLLTTWFTCQLRSIAMFLWCKASRSMWKFRWSSMRRLRYGQPSPLGIHSPFFSSCVRKLATPKWNELSKSFW